MSYHTNRSYSPPPPPAQRAASSAAPPGFHFMPDGTLMSDAEHEMLYGKSAPTEERKSQYYPGLHPYNNPNVGGPGSTIGEALPHTNNGVTVGFSIRSNVWRSRYSFVPTCYSTLDNIMLSHMKPNNPASATPGNIHGYTSLDVSSTWDHDYEAELDNLNTFYRGQTASSLEVVSNHNPSAVKIFKAISIEGDGMWSGSAYTNVGRGSEEPDQQSGGFEFERKEGAFYSDIPASTTVEDFSREMMFVGFVRVEDFYADETNVESINDGFAQLWTLPLVNIPQVSLPTSTDTALYFGRRLVVQSELDALAEDPDYMITTGSLQFESIQRIIPITNPAHATPIGYDGHESNRLQPMSYNSETNSIEIWAGIDDAIALEGGVPFGKGLQYFVDYFLNMGIFEDIVPVPEEYIPVYVSQPVSKTGEMMRGHYVGANISGIGEIFAINVDFENTKLDGSLG